MQDQSLSDLTPGDLRELQAYWFWAVTSRDEEISLGLLGLNPSLAILPMGYTCDCIIKGSHLDIEAFFQSTDENSDDDDDSDEDDLLLLFEMIKTGKCIKTHKTMRMKQREPNYKLEKSLAKLHVVPSKSDSKLRRFSSYDLGVYLIHLAVALDRKQTVKRIFQMNLFVPEAGSNMSQIFCYTLNQRKSYIQTAVACRNHDLLQYLLDKTSRGIDSGELLTACEDAIIRNHSDICDLFVKRFEILYPYQRKRNLLKVLSLTAKHKSYACADVVMYAIRRMLGGKTLHSEDLFEDQNFMKIISKDKTFLKMLLREGIEPLSRWLEKAVVEDDKETAATLTSEFSLKDENIPHLFLQAIIMKSIDMIQVLLSAYNSASQTSHHSEFSSTSLINPRFWATALGYEDCDMTFADSDIPFDTETLRKYSPLNAIHGLTLLKDHEKLKIAMRLVSVGYSPLDGSYGDTKFKEDIPVISAFKCGNRTVAKYLLSLGANPDSDKTGIIDTGYSLSFMVDCLYHNSDIFAEPSSVVRNLIKGGVKKRSILKLILACDCNVSQSDLNRIKQTVDPRSDEFLLTYFTTPPLLSSICRKTFRKHYGYRIHTVLEQLEIPSRLKRYLLLEDELSAYRQIV